MSEKESPWPLGWHAPGGYMCTCHRCGEQFQGDKRSHECLPCAIILAKGKIKAYEGAMQTFCERVEAGTIRSRSTYAEFVHLLGRKTGNPFRTVMQLRSTTPLNPNGEKE